MAYLDFQSMTTTHLCDRYGPFFLKCPRALYIANS